jgi:uncharacterized membrane protein
MTPYVAVGALLALSVLVLAAWRQVMDLHEDDSIHLKEAEAGMVKNQVDLDQRIRVVDRVGKTLTVIAVLYGLAVASWMIYRQWIESAKL